MNTSTLAESNDWVYLKLYLGRAADRMDRVIVALADQLSQRREWPRWFFLRYFDQGGLHVRLRVHTQGHDANATADAVTHLCGEVLSRVHEYLPSDYHPMVVPHNFQGLDAELGARPEVRIAKDVYEPETDKYGPDALVGIAEDVFAVSSSIAAQIIEDESRGLCSRKTLVPMLMRECYSQFKPASPETVFWQQYSRYWLGGDTPAASDWRDRFTDKARELQSQGLPIFADEADLPASSAAVVARWRAVLHDAAQRYAPALADGTVVAEVLAFNFAHLMNNRLGLMSMEEAYMAALIEYACKP